MNECPRTRQSSATSAFRQSPPGMLVMFAPFSLVFSATVVVRGLALDAVLLPVGVMFAYAGGFIGPVVPTDHRRHVVTGGLSCILIPPQSP